MHPFSALGRFQADGDTARHTAQFFLNLVLRLGCSMNYSMVEAATELNKQYAGLKVGKSVAVQAGMDRIVHSCIKTPITYSSLQQYLKKKIPISSMVKKVIIDTQPQMKSSWVGYLYT